MAQRTARIAQAILSRADCADALETLKRLRITTEAKDFGRPPPLLASLYELFTGRAYGRQPGATITFAGPGEAPREDAVDVLWLRIDTRYGDLASSTGKRIELPARLDLLPEHLIKALSERSALLVLDWSHEGRPTFWRSHIRRIAAAYGIPATSIVVLTQNTASSESATGDGAEAHIVNAHAFIPVFWRLVFGNSVRPGEITYDFGFAAQPAARTHRFICTNFEATATRALIAARLLERPEPGHLSFRKDQFRRNMPGSDAFKAEIDQVSIQRDRRANHLNVDSFVAHARNYAIDLPPGMHPRHAAYFMPADALRRSELNIVTEQEMGLPDQKRFTEKTLKAVIAGLPSVVFGNQNTIGLLEDAGLDLLSDLIDHSYDADPDPADRFDGAWHAVEDWLDRAPGFTDSDYQRLQAAAAHNRAVFEGPLFRRWVLAPLCEIAALHPAVDVPADSAPQQPAAA